jgi:hypothetical protein
MSDGGLRLARTNAEAHLYMGLHPCPVCGRAINRYRSSVVTVDGVLASRYRGTCDHCGTERVFEFRIPDEVLPPPADRVRFGAADPSELLDPGEWLAHADDQAGRVPADPSGLAGERRRAARHALATALAAVEEVLKFVPPGADEVPAERFTSPVGRAVRDAEPGRFRRDRLEVVRDAYETGLGRYVA